MTNYSCLLAQVEGLNPLNPTAPVTKGTGLLFMDVLVIVGTGLALGLVLLLWARYYVRTHKRRHHHEHRTDPVPTAALTGPEADDPGQPHGRRRRKRRHRRDHRPRNPTLAETGGLPPPKTEPSSNPPL